MDQNMVRKSERRGEIDAAKGLALLSVVLGHVILLHTFPSNWIYTFHMPVFFFLSGMTFRPEKYDGLLPFLKDKARKRLLPYLGITALAFFICMLRPAYRAPVLNDGWSHQLLWIFYYTQPQNLYVGQLWFLVALFWAELMAWIWFQLAGKRHLLVKCYSVFLLALLAVRIQEINPYLPVGNRLPWKIDSALCACVFLIAGYWTAKGRLLERLRPAALVFIPLFTYLSFYFGPRLFGYVNICDCVYVGAPYYYGAAFLGTAALVLAGDFLKKSRLLCFIGRHSLPLFAAQTFAIYLVIEGIAEVTGIAYIPMFEMPGEKACLLITLAALLLMLAGLWVYLECKKWIFHRFLGKYL